MSLTTVSMAAKHPLIVVIGATGTGKSSLAVTIAKHLQPQGEIINGDAMQLYKGLPTITNKLGAHEQAGVPHHLLDTIDLSEETWTVQKFVQEAEKIIATIRSRGKVPILVGGTSYYVHGTLMGSSMLPKDENGVKSESDTLSIKAHKQMDGDERTAVLNKSTDELYSMLAEVDPIIVKRWHPADRRKIQRSLEIWLKTGRRASDIYAEQKSTEMGVSETNGVKHDIVNQSLATPSHPDLRHDPLIFWLDAEDTALKSRLDERVDKMIAKGLIDEAKDLAAFEADCRSHKIPVDQSRGIWVSIGYKELAPYIAGAAGLGEDHGSKQLSKIRDACVESVKASTRRYAKRQNRYIRIRLATALAHCNVLDRLFLLDTTHAEDFDRAVVKPALTIVDAFLAGKPLPDPASLSVLAQETFTKMAVAQHHTAEEREARRCEACDKTLMTQSEYEKHVKSRGHRRVMEGIKRQQENKKAFGPQHKPQQSQKPSDSNPRNQTVEPD